jgi:hypothetical protein
LTLAVKTTGALDRRVPLVYFVAAQFAANLEVLKPFPYNFTVGSHLNLSIVHRTYFAARARLISVRPICPGHVAVL